MKPIYFTPLWVVLLTACSRPNAANIQLRKENQQLRDQIIDLQRNLGGAQASVRSLESHATTVPILPADQLDKLFVACELKLGRGTGQADLDALRPGDEGLKIAVVPVDQVGDPIKAAGAFTVDAFDLLILEHPRIGHWEFPLEKAGENFHSMLSLYGYVLPCPWQQLPAHKDITVRVSFQDALTGRALTAEAVVKVNPAATTMPAAEVR